MTAEADYDTLAQVKLRVALAFRGPCPDAPPGAA
jgi:hypothetical protein